MLRPAFPNFESYDGFERLDDLSVLFKDGFLHVSDDVFTALANRAATRVSFYLRARHLQALRAVFDDSADLFNTVAAMNVHETLQHIGTYETNMETLDAGVKKSTKAFG